MKILRSSWGPSRAGLTGALLVVSSPGLGFSGGDTIPGYANQIPTGSRADVRTTASYHDGVGWTVTFRRRLDTGDPQQDVIFAKGGSYAFQVATFDNGGGKEDPFHQVQNQTTVFTMTIPETPGDLVFSGKPARLSALSGKLLASDEIEITASWADPTRNDRRGQWTLGSNGVWSKNAENEDRIAFVWDMQNDDLASAGNCAATFQNDLHRTVTPGSKVDNWHWKASRSHPIGYSDDQFWYDGTAHDGNGRRDDPGLSAALENVLEDGHPKYMAESDPGANVKSLFLLQPGSAGMKEAAIYGDGAWTQGTRLAGYVMRPPTGSRADVRATANYQAGVGWTVTFRRKLDTGDPGQDIIFAKGGTYAFQVATFDNGGGKEDPFHQVQNQTKVFRMTIPQAPGELIFSEKPARLTALAGRLLASDEIEITASWTDSTRHDRRGEWTLGSNGVWSKNAENEDRIAFIWDMQNDGLASAGNCAATCHNDLHRTVTPGSKVDNWHWKASRSHPIGYSDDQWWYDGSQHGGNGRRDDAGLSTVIENVLENGHPKYMAAGGPGVSAQFLYLDSPQADGWARAVAYANESRPAPTPSPTPTPAANRAPVAHAGSDRTMKLGNTVSLDGRGSGDPDGGPVPLTYRWSQTAGPSVSLADAESATPRFTPLLPGTYGFSLRVADGATESEPDTVFITVADVPLLVLGPNGGEQWTARTSQTIRWHVSEALANTAKPVSVLYSKNGGKRWVLLKKVSAKSGTWQWKPRPAQASAEARIQVCAAASKPKARPVCDVSDGNFAVLK